MSLTTEEFVSALIEACPEARPIVNEHREEFGSDVLLHLLIADVRRFAITSFEAGNTDVLSRCLGAVAAGMSDGDDYVQNAIGVSFVEDTPLWDPAMEPYIATWPQPLQVEAAKQRRS